MNQDLGKYLVILLMGFLLWSCNLDPCSDYDFEDCSLDEPVDALFVLKLTKPENQDSVLVLTYKGKIDDGELIDSFYSYLTKESYYLEVNQYYSAVAEYYKGDDTIRVVDGQELRTVKTTKCEETCWKIKGDELDLRLKF